MPFTGALAGREERGLFGLQPVYQQLNLIQAILTT